MLRRIAFKARPSHECGLLPLPKGEGWGEGLQTIDRSEPPHPNPLPSPRRRFPTSSMKLSGRTLVNPSSAGERESRRATVKLCAHYEGARQYESNVL